MELATTILQQGLVFLFTYTTTLVVLSRPEQPLERRSVWDGLQELLEPARARFARRDFEPTIARQCSRSRLSDETWRRLMHVHMINAVPHRRM